MEINCNGKSYIIEGVEGVEARSWFIIAQNPTTDLDFIEAERLSKIWYNITYMGCKYAPEIHQIIIKIANELYI